MPLGIHLDCDVGTSSHSVPVEAAVLPRVLRLAAQYGCMFVFRRLSFTVLCERLCHFWVVR